MFKKNKKLIVVLLSLLIIAIVPIFTISSGYGADFINNIMTKYFGMDQKEINKTLTALSFDELVQEIDTLAKEGDSEELIFYSSELLARKESINNDQLIKVIVDNTKNPATRAIIVNLYVAKNENSKQDSLKALLLNPKTEYGTKDDILANSKITKDDKEILKYFIYNDDGVLAFRAFRQLSIVDEQEAFEIAKSILKNWPKETDYRISGAQKSIVTYLRSTQDAVEIKDFITQTQTILNSEKCSDMIKESCGFALCNINSKASLEALINNKLFDLTLKKFAIDQNYYVLLNILKNPNCSEQDIEFVLSAMEILPITDIKPYIKDAMSNIKNEDLLNRCQKVIDLIEKDGINASKKRD